MQEIDFLGTLDVETWKQILHDAEILNGIKDVINSPGIHRSVDVSDAAMSKAFDLLDREGRGALTKEQFVDGINRCITSFGGKPIDVDHEAITALWQATSLGQDTSAMKAEMFAKVKLLTKGCSMTLYDGGQMNKYVTHLINETCVCIYMYI